MTTINPDFVERVRKIAAALDTLDYYQLLRVSPDATHTQIRSGYHDQARSFHPDRFNHYGLPELSAQLTLISKRISEAYVVLRDEQTRQQYRTLLEGNKRSENLRYRHEQEEKHRAKKEENLAFTAPGKKMYDQASRAYARGDLQEAIKTLKMAIVYEAKNHTLTDVLEKWMSEEG